MIEKKRDAYKDVHILGFAIYICEIGKELLRENCEINLK